MANKKYEEEAEANREAARERRLARVSSKDEKRRMLIGANQEMLKKSRQEEKTRMRGDRAVPKLEKVPELELDNLEVGTWMTGRVRRLVGYGAWVDVGSDVDGFLHVNAIKDGFVHHPADELTPGQSIEVCVKNVDLDEMKLGLSCLGAPVKPHYWAHGAWADFGEDGRDLDEFEDDEMVWGVVARVTHFGAFVDVGCECKAFLHASDVPARQLGQWAPDLFTRGQRVRAYVKEVDLNLGRLKITGFRPKSLPKVPF